MASWRYEISPRVEKIFHAHRSLRSLVKYLSTLEEKFRISARPCNILYIFVSIFFYYLVFGFYFYSFTVTFEIA